MNAWRGIVATLPSASLGTVVDTRFSCVRFFLSLCVLGVHSMQICFGPQVVAGHLRQSSIDAQCRIKEIICCPLLLAPTLLASSTAMGGGAMMLRGGMLGFRQEAVQSEWIGLFVCWDG